MKKYQFISSSILPSLLLLYSCKDDDLRVILNQKAQGNGIASLSYLNSRDTNTLIPLAHSSSFPDLNQDVTETNSGSFVQTWSQCEGPDVFFDFSIKNTGTGPLKATKNPAVTLTDTTDYNKPPFSSAPYTIVTPPSFPIFPGASTTFRVKFSSEDNSCAYGSGGNYYSLFPSGHSDSRQEFNMVIHTDDAINPDYGVDFVILGSC